MGKTTLLLPTVSHCFGNLAKIYLRIYRKIFSPTCSSKYTVRNPKDPIICAMVKSRYIGDGHPTFNRNPYNGSINPYYWVDEFIPYYMEIMGV